MSSENVLISHSVNRPRHIYNYAILNNHMQIQRNPTREPNLLSK